MCAYVHMCIYVCKYTVHTDASNSDPFSHGHASLLSFVYLSIPNPAVRSVAPIVHFIIHFHKMKFSIIQSSGVIAEWFTFGVWEKTLSNIMQY
jgi:hypothetical protein